MADATAPETITQIVWNFIFNAIANSSGGGSVNASSALIELFAGIMFHFFT
jgi:anaerobic ribonucleoside-triphosphate reductase